MRALVRNVWGAKLHISGAENIPSAGPALVAINQTSHLDPLFIAIAVERPIHFIGVDDGGSAEPWYTPALFRSIGVIDRPEKLLRSGGHHFASSLEAAVRYAELIGIFPEGRIERKHDRTAIAPFRKGVATIARQFHLPVIPVLMRGTEDVIPNSTARLHEKIYVRPIRITLGPPIPPEEVRDGECVRRALLDLDSQAVAKATVRKPKAQPKAVAAAENSAD